MFSAKDIAIWFLIKNNAEVREHEVTNDDYEVYEGITHLKLQKLLYYAQGVFLAITGKRLFKEPIEAWQHGPVVAEVYDEYKKFGRNNISIEVDPNVEDVIRNIESNVEVSNVLNMVYDNFAIYTAWQLREMSHVKNGPWDKAMSKNKKIIDLNEIKNFFESEIVTDG